MIFKKNNDGKEKLKNCMNKIKNIKKVYLSMPQAIAFFLVASVLLVRFQTGVLSGSLFFDKDALSMEWQPVLVFFNMIPLFLAMCLVYFLFGSVSASFSFTSIVFLIMLLVNHFKVEFRAEPFIPTDITTLGEATNVSSNLDFKFSALIVISIILIVLVNILMWMFVRSRKEKWRFKICGIILSCILGITSYTTVYSDVDRYKYFPSFADVWKDISVMENKGFMYMFMTRFELFSYDEPDGYSAEAVERIYAENKVDSTLPEGYVPPDVIAIMGESYFDIKRTNIKPADGINPTENLERLREDGVYGDLIVRGIGGGTVISEFEFLTANAMPFITDTNISPYNTYITREAYSIPRYLKDAYGYSTIAMHTGNEWFYNRKSTYPRLGFDSSKFFEDIAHTNPEIGFNGYTYDSVLSEMIISAHKKHQEENPGQRYFNFNVTVENHLPYDEWNPLEAEYVIRPEGMPENHYYMINRYVEKLKNTDAVLGDVADYLETIDTPAVVVFYGDHLPNLNQQTEDILSEIGIDISKSGYEGDLNTHRTPYVIWGNSAYRQQMEQFDMPVDIGKQQTISSNYLGIKLLEYMNVPMSEHFKFVQSVKDELPVVTPYYYVNAENRQIDALDDRQKKMIDDYKIIQYYAVLKYNK